MKNYPNTVRLILNTLGLLTLLHSPLLAQRFSAAFTAGINAAQIDGDDLAGFDHLGFTTGIISTYALKSNQDLTIEILYNQSGSKSLLGFGTPPGVESIDLNYIEIPFLFKLKDWSQDEGYHKVFLDAGLSFARLFTSNFKNSFFRDFQNDFAKSKLSLALGAGYYFNKHVGMNFRYTRSLTSLYSNARFFPRPLREYFVTFRLEYKI